MESLVHGGERKTAVKAPFALAQPEDAWCFPFDGGNPLIGLALP